jgi:hypothetical protein
MGVYLMGVYLMGVCLMGVCLMAVCLMAAYLMGVYLMGVYLIDVHLMDVHLIGDRSCFALGCRPPKPGRIAWLVTNRFQLTPRSLMDVEASRNSQR